MLITMLLVILSNRFAYFILVLCLFLPFWNFCVHNEFRGTAMLLLSDETMTKLSSVKIYFFGKNLNVIIVFWYACSAGRFNRT